MDDIFSLIFNEAGNSLYTPGTVIVKINKWEKIFLTLQASEKTWKCKEILHVGKFILTNGNMKIVCQWEYFRHAFNGHMIIGHITLVSWIKKKELYIL